MARLKRIKVAVIGAGNMGRNHMRNYAMLPMADLVGFADVNPESKKLARKYRVKHYLDFRKMVDELKPDAVSIAVPTPLHLEVGVYCLEKGIHCLVEKPIAPTVKEADLLIGTAEKHQLVFTVGHIERFNPVVQKIKEIIKSKQLGKVLSVVCIRVGGFPNVEPKTDVIIDLAVHDIDIINYLLGRLPDSLTSHGSKTHHTQEIDSAKILLDYGNAAGFVQANWVTPVKVRTISVTGSHGYIQGNYITQQLTHYKHNMQSIKNGFASFVDSLGQPEKEIINVDFAEPLAIELSAFLEAIRTGDDSMMVNSWDAREALRLALQAIKPYRKIA